MIAAIDIGSNAVRLYICSFFAGSESASQYKEVQYLRVPLRLGDYVFMNHEIPPHKEAALIKLMTAFANLMQLYGVQYYRACSTSAMREAKNSGDITQKILAQTGINIEIISGQEEAELILNAHQDFLKPKEITLLVDVGGGSTEITLMNGKTKVVSKSFELGTVRILDNQDDDKTWTTLRNWLRIHIKPQKPECIIGTGGNIKKLMELLKTPKNKSADSKSFEKICKQIEQFSLKERVQLLGLNPNRADVILPAAHVFYTILQETDIKQIKASHVGLKDGLILQIYEKYGDTLYKYDDFEGFNI